MIEDALHKSANGKRHQEKEIATIWNISHDMTSALLLVFVGKNLPCFSAR